MEALSPSGYSSSVQLQLHVGGQVYELSHTGPERLILCEPQALPSGEAELIITIDGKPQRHEIILRGSNAPSREIFYW